MVKEIEIGTSIEGKTKEKEWTELGKRFGADKLYVLAQGEKYPAIASTHVYNKYGYQLTWHVKEDDIHIHGSGSSDVEGRKGLSITVDETLFCEKSQKKLASALACLEYIEKNRKKYFH